MLTQLASDFRQILPRVEFCSLRFVNERNEILNVRQDVPEPVQCTEDIGVMLTVVDKGGLGYAATSDLTRAGLKRAVDRAVFWAEQTRASGVTDFSRIPFPQPSGEYEGPEEQPWDSVGLKDKLDLLQARCRTLKTDPRIVDWSAGLWHARAEMLYLTSGGGKVHQRFHYLVPSLSATANHKTDTQTRSFGGLRQNCRQGGLEILDEVGFSGAGPRIAEEALELLAAPNCPSGTMHLLAAPDQMVLQVHESIGHPLELDRILGDERNYAGTSFVTLDMLGTYRYGSPLLNITYDPTDPNEFASFGYDDEGLPAKKTFIIEKGILKRALGGTTSQARSGLEGVANCRACNWNRPPSTAWPT